MKKTIFTGIVFLIFTTFSLFGFAAKLSSPIQAKGPYGGRIYDVIASPNDSNTLYAIAGDKLPGREYLNNGKLYKSTDGGKNWTQIGKSLSNYLHPQYYTSLSAHGQTIFLTTTSNIYKSYDGGQSWQASNNGLPDSCTVYDLTFVDDTIIADTNQGLYISKDNGNTWSRLPTPNSQHAKTNLIKNSAVKHDLIQSGKVIYYITANSQDNTVIYKSTDLGKTWINISYNIPHDLNITSLTVDNDGTLYIGTVINGAYELSNGDQWQNISTGLPKNCLINNLYVSDGILYAATANGLYQKSLGDNQWSLSAFKNIVTYNLTKIDDYYYAATDSGLWKSNKIATNWKSLNHGIISTTVYTMINVAGTLYAGTYGNGVFISLDHGIHWTRSNNGLTNTYINKLASLNGVLYAGTNDGLFESKDNGLTWQSVSANLEHDQVTDIAFERSVIFVTISEKGVFRSTDLGQHWTAINNGVIKDKNAGKYYVDSILLDGKTLFLSGRYLYRSTDEGKTWQQVEDWHFTPFRSSPERLFVNNNTLFVTNANADIFRSSDDGNTWQQLSFPEQIYSTSKYSYSFAVNNNILYVSDTNGNVFASVDNGSTLTKVISNPGVIFQSLAFVNNKLIAGTRYSGIYLD